MRLRQRPQHLAYDAWWHLGHDTLVTREWGTPDTFENGPIPEVLLGAPGTAGGCIFWGPTQEDYIR